VICDGIDPRSTNGPGKLCRVLGIDMTFNGAKVVVCDDGVPPPGEPLITTRIGITKAVDMPRRWAVP
jgi:DNA-3-methyladenine glycosylase